MINSNSRKLILSGWLKENDVDAYNSSVRLQKFLFLYESFCRVNGEQYDFSDLKGYVFGPVFSRVWGDYSYERNEFDIFALNAYRENTEYIIHDDWALRSDFIVSSLSTTDLSAFTHEFNIWKSKSDLIGPDLTSADRSQISLSDDDFDYHDCCIIRSLELMYPMDLVLNSCIFSIGSSYFVIDSDSFSRLNEHQIRLLSSVSDDRKLHNPIFVDVDDEGRLYID